MYIEYLIISLGDRTHTNKSTDTNSVDFTKSVIVLALSFILQRMTHLKDKLRNIWRQTPKTNPRRVHQIQLSHPRRFNAYKVAGYSFGALTAIIVGPIVLWPIADVWLLPKVLSSSLQAEPSTKYKEKYAN